MHETMGSASEEAGGIGLHGIKHMLIDMLKPQIEPILTKHKLTWTDVTPVLLSISNTAMNDADVEPDAVLIDIIKKIAAVRLRPKLEPKLPAGVSWEDIQPALELVKSAEDLDYALSHPEEFLVKLMESIGCAAKNVAAQQLP